jgi:hypothetical protein
VAPLVPPELLELELDPLELLELDPPELLELELDPPELLELLELELDPRPPELELLELDPELELDPLDPEDDEEDEPPPPASSNCGFCVLEHAPAAPAQATAPASKHTGTLENFADIADSSDGGEELP